MFGRDNLRVVERVIYKLNGKDLLKVSNIIDDIFRANIRRNIQKKNDQKTNKHTPKT